MFKPNKVSILILTVVLLLTVGLFTWAQDEQPVPVDESTTEVSAEQEVKLDETVSAEDLDVKEPTLLPDSKFYFLKNLGRSIRSIFTFDKVKKAELKLKFASEKLLEAGKLAEKKKKAEIIEKAADKYKEEIDKIKEAVDKIKETATTSPSVGKFLDKFEQQSVLHYRLLEKLKEQVPTSTPAFQKIEAATERHLENFKEVMLKLEAKATDIGERLQKNLEAIQGSQFKDFKNLEILEKIEEKLPEKAKEAVQNVRENTLLKLKEKLEKAPVQLQEKFKEYAEKISGEEEVKMEIIEDIRFKIKDAPKLEKLKEGLEETREKLLEGYQKRLEEKIKKQGFECPMIAPIPPDFCPEGRVIIPKDERGCPLTPKCIELGETEATETEAIIKIPLPQIESIEVEAEPVR